jgi:hypothetical protein
MMLNNFGLPIEPVGYTPDEFNKMLSEKNAFAEEIIKGKRII